MARQQIPWETIGAVLAEVRDCAPVTVAAVAEGVGVSKSTARRLLSQLEVAGLVEWDDYQRRARVYLPVERSTTKEG